MPTYLPQIYAKPKHRSTMRRVVCRLCSALAVLHCPLSTPSLVRWLKNKKFTANLYSMHIRAPSGTHLHDDLFLSNGMTKRMWCALFVDAFNWAQHLRFDDEYHVVFLSFHPMRLHSYPQRIPPMYTSYIFLLVVLSGGSKVDFWFLGLGKKDGRGKYHDCHGNDTVNKAPSVAVLWVALGWQTF